MKETQIAASTCRSLAPLIENKPLEGFMPTWGINKENISHNMPKNISLSYLEFEKVLRGHLLHEVIPTMEDPEFLPV